MPLHFAVVFASAFIAVIAWLASVQLVLSRVQRAHPDLYERMGRPHVILNNTLRNNGPILRFILGRGYRGLQDPLLERLGDRARMVFFVTAVLMCTWFAVAISYMAAGSEASGATLRSRCGSDLMDGADRDVVMDLSWTLTATLT